MRCRIELIVNTFMRMWRQASIKKPPNYEIGGFNPLILITKTFNYKKLILRLLVPNFYRLP